MGRALLKLRRSIELRRRVGRLGLSDLLQIPTGGVTSPAAAAPSRSRCKSRRYSAINVQGFVLRMPLQMKLQTAILPDEHVHRHLGRPGQDLVAVAFKLTAAESIAPRMGYAPFMRQPMQKLMPRGVSR